MKRFLKVGFFTGLAVLALMVLAGCSDDIPSESEQPTTQQAAQQPAAETTEAEGRPESSEASEQAQEQPAAPAPAEAEQAQSSAEEEEADESVEVVEEDEEEQAAQETAPVPEWNSDDALPFDPAVTIGTLSNGLTFYIRENQEPLERAQLSLVVMAGSVLEEEQQRGLAHFLEHMAFNGTERFAKQEIVDYIESIGSNFGAHLNAFTSYDYTVYFLEVPTDDPEILEKAFQILSDWAYAISLEPEEIELERGVILEEWRLYLGFGSRFQTHVFPLIFGDSIYSERAPIGLPEVFETAPVEEFRAFYQRWYQPHLMAVVAVGDFDQDLIEQKIAQYFAPPPQGEAHQPGASVSEPTERPRYPIQDNDEPIVDVFTDPEAPGTQVILVRKVAPERGADLGAFRRDAVERLAFMMFNARLSERGQASDPPWLWSDSGRSALIDPLDILTFAIVTEQDGVENGVAALLEEMQRVSQHGFTTAELERESANLLSSVEGRYNERDQQESRQLADSYRDHFLGESPVPGVEAEWQLYQQLLPQITLEEVNAHAVSWTQSENTLLIVLGPDGIEIGEEGALAAALEIQLDEADAMVVEPYGDDFDDVPLLATIPTPGTIVNEEELGEIDAVRWTLSNGITVIAKQTDFKNDEVQFSAFSPGGNSLVSDEDYVSATYAAEFAQGSGVGPHDRVALDKLLAGKRVSVSPYIDELFEGLNGNASPQDLETMFQLITLYATEPRFDSDHFARMEAQQRTTAELRPTQPDWVLYDRVNTLLGQSHLRRRPLSLEVLQDLDMGRAESVYRDRFADLGDATFVFSGAFDWDELRSLTTTYLASLPTTGRSEAWRDVGANPPDGIVDEEVRIGIEPRSNTVWVYAGHADWSSDDPLALEVAGEMLGTRLRERVREALGGTYGIWVSTRATRLPDNEYRVIIIFGSDPDRVEELRGEVEIELDWIRNGGEQSYLDTVKEQLRTSRTEDLRDNEFWVGQIRRAVQRGHSLAQINRFDERLDSLTLDDVAAAAQLTLQDRFVRVVLYPEDE